MLRPVNHEQRLNDLMNEAARRFPGDGSMTPREIQQQRLDWIDFQQFGNLPGDFDPRSNEGSYGTDQRRRGLSLEFPRGAWSLGVVRGNIEEREDGPVLVASTPGEGWERWLVRGAFGAIGLVLLTIGVAVVATGVSPVQQVQKAARGALT